MVARPLCVELCRVLLNRCLSVMRGVARSRVPFKVLSSSFRHKLLSYSRNALLGQILSLSMLSASILVVLIVWARVRVEGRVPVRLMSTPRLLTNRRRSERLPDSRHKCRLCYRQ